MSPTGTRSVHLVHPKEWILVLALLIASVIDRIWIATEDRRDDWDPYLARPHGAAYMTFPHSLRHKEDISGFLANNCRRDLESLCDFPPTLPAALIKSPKPTDDTSKEEVALYFIHNEKSCKRKDIPANPVLALLGQDFVHEVCAWEGQDPSKRKALQDKDPQRQRQLVRMIVERSLKSLSKRFVPSISSTKNAISWETPTFRAQAHFLMEALSSNKLGGEELGGERIGGEHFPVLSDGEFMVLPSQEILLRDVLTFQELHSLMKEAVLKHNEGHAQAEAFTQAMLEALDQPRELKILKQRPPRLPALPMIHGVQRSECLRLAFVHDLSLSQSCSTAVAITADRMQDLEVELNFPIAAAVKWLYLVLAVAALWRLGDRLGQGETKSQRARRQFVQQMRDPYLRRGIELQAIRELGEESAATMMQQLECKAAAMEAEARDSDDEWKRQEALMVAWRQRLMFMNGVRGMCAILGLVSLTLLWLDKPEAGTVVEGLCVVLTAFLGTYFFLPASPSQQSSKRSELKEPLLVSDTA